jgi:hypothetical protein
MHVRRGGTWQSSLVRSPRVARMVAVALAGATLLLAACGGDDTLDTEKAASEIRRGLEGQTGLEVDGVTCPEEILADAGATFECVATLEGQRLQITVTQKDDDGNVRWEADQAVIDLRKAEREVAAQIAEQTGVPVSVDCGTRTVSINDPSDEFSCEYRARDGTAEGTISVTVKDTKGNVDFEVVE